MDPNSTDISMAAATTGAAAFATKILVDVITMGWPSRPTYVGPVAAILIGIACTFLQFLTTATTITAQLCANAVLLGIVVGGLAMGITASSNSAEAKRSEASRENRAEARPKKKAA